MVDDIGDSDEKAVSQSSESRARKKSGFKKSGSRPVGRKEIKKVLDIVFDEIIECPESVSDRVDYIADIMSELRWARGKSGRLIAKRWGLAQSTVDGYASEASRKIVVDREAASRDITVIASKLMLESARAGDTNGVWKMADILAKVSGANAPTKQENVISLGESTPKTAREIMSTVFKGGVGEGAAEDQDSEPENRDSNRPTLDSADPALADPEDELN